MPQVENERTEPVSSSPAPRLLFVGGLHRSGTSLIHRCIARHPDVTGFSGTGVPEDEGQHLQSVFPRAYDHGGPGRFGFDQRAHLTEDSPLVTAANRSRLLEEWSAHWDPEAPVRVEKSPPNLVRMRFLKALFPESAFLMVTRHPAAVACATQKWSRTPWASLVHHWVAAHETMVLDSEAVAPVIILRYEDFVADPERELAAVFEAVGLPPHPVGEEVRQDINRRYFALWRGTRNPLRVLDRRIATSRFDGAVRPFGYSLRDVDILERPDRGR
jgi:Sulfotransferase family